MNEEAAAELKKQQQQQQHGGGVKEDVLKHNPAEVNPSFPKLQKYSLC